MAEKRPSIVQCYNAVAGWMLGEEPNALAKQFGPFPHSYLVTPDGDVLETDQHKIVKLTTREKIAGQIMRLLREKFPESEGLQWTAKQADGFVDYWAYASMPIEMPRSWSWPGEDVYSFHQIPFRTEAGATPLFDELMRRVDNSAALMLWIGSLFFEQADRQTYVWLYGGGGDGKGALLRALIRVFGSAHKAENVPERGTPFWTYWLIGKRLISFGDTNAAGFVASGLFKSLTGGDRVRVEIKGGASYDVELDAMFIFASNERPKLSSEKADMRRAILCEFESVPGEQDPTYEHRMWDEMPSFVHRCMEAYRERGHYGPIMADKASLERWVGTLEDRFEALIEENLIIYPDHETCFVLATHMTRFLLAHAKQFGSPTDFLNYLERKYKIKRTTVRAGKERDNGYKRIQFRDPHIHRVRNYTGSEFSFSSMGL